METTGATGLIGCALIGATAGAASTPWAARLVIAGPDRDQRLPAAWRAAAASPSSTRLQLGAGAATAAGGALGAAAAGWSADLPAFALLGLLGAVLAVIDIRTHRLPNRLVLALALGLTALLGAAAWLGPEFDAADLRRALACGALGVAALGAMSLLAGGGLGPGDAKLFGVLAIALGWRGAGAVLWGAMAGFAMGAAVALALLVTRRAGLRTALPFGPSLVLGALMVCVLWPH